MKQVGFRYRHIRDVVDLGFLNELLASFVDNNANFATKSLEKKLYNVYKVIWFLNSPKAVDERYCWKINLSG